MSQVNANSNVAESASGAQEHGAKPPPPPQKHVIQTHSYANPCGYPATREGSDLCAQWTAAVAARDTANWQPYIYNVDLGAGVATALAVILAFLAFRSSSRSEVAQTRAYLFPDSVVLIGGEHKTLIGSDHERVPGVMLALKNFGTTPARNVKHWGKVILYPNVAGFEPPAHGMSRVVAEGVYPPHSTQSYPIPLTDDPTVDWEIPWCPLDNVLDEIRKGTIGIMLYGRITYRDAFNKKRWTNYRLSYSGKWPPPEGISMRFSTFGNDST